MTEFGKSPGILSLVQGKAAPSSSILDRGTPSPSRPLSPTQALVDHGVSAFTHQATDIKTFATLVAAGGAYRLGRLGVLSADAGAFRGLPLKVVSLTAGLGSEVIVFEVANRGLDSVQPNPWRWDGTYGMRQGLLNSFITFSTLKGAGRLAQGENILIQHFLQDSAMVVGHQVSGAFGFTPKPSGTWAEQFLNAEATNLQLAGAMALGRSMTLGKLEAMERGADLSILLSSSSKEGRNPFQNNPYAPLFAMAGRAPGEEREVPTILRMLSPNIVVSLSSYRLGSESDLRVESTEKSYPKVESERVEQLREAIKSDLRQNSDWRRITQGDFSFIDRLSPEQFLAIEAVLKVHRPEVGEPAQLLKRMKESGFLDGQLLSLPPESLRGFASAASTRAKDGKGRSFAERVLHDYSEWKTPSGYFGRSRESGILFETLYDPATKTQRTRFDLLMEAYYWMQVGTVTGSRAVVDGTTGEYYDSHRVVKPLEPTGFGERGWTSIESERQWRGNIDEAIRMGQMAKKNSWRIFYPEALQYVDMALGSVEYRAFDGGKAHDPLQPDGYRNDNWAEEYKSTYHQGVPADFSLSAMKNEISFRNQVLKYGAAVKQGKLDGIIYRVTAKSIDPLVVDYIKKQIPNIRVIRYDSITDTEGKVVLEQATQAPVERPEVLKETRKRAEQSDYPFLIEDGKFTTYHLPPRVPDAAGTAFRDQLALYTDTLTLKKMEYRDLGARLVDRARRQTEWLGRIYDHLDAPGRQALDAKVKAFTTKLDAELPALKDEVSKAKMIAERIDALARETIQKNLLVWDEAPLGTIDGITGKPPEGLGLLEDLPGQFKVYLTTPEARGPFQPSALKNKLRLPVGARIYQESLTLDQVEVSFPAPPSSSKGSKGKAVDTKRGSVLNFNAPLNLEQDPSLEKKTDEAGRDYYEVKKEMVLEKGGYDIPYLGDNPLFDFYQPAVTAAKP